MTDIVSVNRTARLALTDSGDLCPITGFLDEDGDETEDPAQAVVAVGQLPADGPWFTVDLREFQEVEAN